MAATTFAPMNVQQTGTPKTSQINFTDYTKKVDEVHFLVMKIAQKLGIFMPINTEQTPTQPTSRANMQTRSQFIPTSNGGSLQKNTSNSNVTVKNIGKNVKMVVSHEPPIQKLPFTYDGPDDPITDDFQDAGTDHAQTAGNAFTDQQHDAEQQKPVANSDKASEKKMIITTERSNQVVVNKQATMSKEQWIQDVTKRIKDSAIENTTELSVAIKSMKSYDKLEDSIRQFEHPHIARFFEYQRNEAEVKKSTLQNYEGMFKLLAAENPWPDRKQLNKPLDLTHMVEKLKNIGKKKKHSIETKKLWGRQLNCMFNVLYNHKSKGNLLGKKHENVYKKDDTITDEAFQEILLDTKEQVIKCEGSKTKKKIAFFNYLYFLLGYYTGSRAMTTLKYKFGDFTLQQSRGKKVCSVEVNERKTEKKIPLNTVPTLYYAVQHAREYHDFQEDENIEDKLIFGIQSKTGLWSRIRSLRQKYPALKTFTAKTLRKLFIRKVSAVQGQDAARASVDHTSAKTTQRYDKVGVDVSQTFMSDGNTLFLENVFQDTTSKKRQRKTEEKNQKQAEKRSRTK